MDDLTEFIKEIGSYNILNNLLPGAVYSFYLYFFASINYMDLNIVVLLFVMYFLGLFISRIGSLIESVIIKKTKIESRDYKSYVKAEKIDSKIRTLQRDANMYRSLASMQLIALISINLIKPKILNLPFIIFMMAGIAVFLCSYIKQRKFIIDRIDIALKNIEDKKSQ